MSADTGRVSPATTPPDTGQGSGLRAVLRDVPLLLAATAVAVVVVVAVTPTVATRVVALLWVVAGLALAVGAARRPEPTVAFRIIGASCVLVGLAWGGIAAVGSADPPGVLVVQLLVPGVTGIGVGTLMATPTWRHRASLLDGVVLSLATAALLIGFAAPDNIDGVLAVAAYALCFAAVLGPAVMLTSLVPKHLQAVPGTTQPAIALGSLAVGGVLVAAAALDGRLLTSAMLAPWVLAPVAGAVMAWRPAPSYREPEAPGVVRPPPVRMATLTLLAFAPAAVAAVRAPGLLVPALLVSLFAMVVVAARVAVSARFDVEEAQAAADVRFDALVEHAAEVLALLDDDGRLFYISQAVQETFHVPPAEVLGLSPVELAHPDDVEEVEDILGRVRERPGDPVHARLRLMDGYGAARHVEATCVDLRHVPGVEAISLTVRDISERVALEAELVRQARTDSLTGLATRTVLIERMDHALTARRPSAALLFIDLDDFKLVNDGFGHAAGDEVLAVLASRIGAAVRVHDTAGRIGGDEFAVLVEELDGNPLHEAVRVAERILADATDPIPLDGEPLEVRMSVGVALAEAGMTTAELFAAADAAMYEAKRERRGLAVYEPGMRGSSRSRLRLMRDVRTAIEEGELTISYQPIVTVDSLALHGAEALLRWEHPTLGNITPDIILDHAEAVGMTAELTDRIVETIATDLRTWRSATGQRLDLAINLSAEQLVHIEPEEVLLRLVGGTDAAGHLTIEITETSMLRDITAAAQVLNVFRDAGCRVAIDDFGTGYASIGYLRRLPLDRLKIDREFVDGLTPATVDGSFASVIQGLASALGLATTAEGVETEEQLEAVRRLGCAHLQGWLVSRGLPMDEFVAWARSTGRVTDPA